MQNYSCDIIAAMNTKSNKSRTIEVNIADYSVDVSIDPKYHVIQEVMEKYYELQEGLDTYLKELCHPYKNWQFIVNETKNYALNYFYILKTHPKGPEAARLYVDICLETMQTASQVQVKVDAFTNLYHLCQKFIKETDSDFHWFLPVLYETCTKLRELPGNIFAVAARGYDQLKKLGQIFLQSPVSEEDIDVEPLNSLLIRFFDYTFSYWLSEPDPREWFINEIDHTLAEKIGSFFDPISHFQMQHYQKQLKNICNQNLKTFSTLKQLLELPGYGEIVNHYNVIVQKLSDALIDEKQKNQYKLILLSHYMNIRGLALIHEEVLRDINRIIRWLIDNEEIRNIKKIILQAFEILGKSLEQFPETVQFCVLNMGKGVYHTRDSGLINFFNDAVVRLGFQAPDFAGPGEHWQSKGSTAHIQNIRTWMELIELNPKKSKKLLSSLIIHLSVTGVLINDTDLFQRDITSFLSSEIQPVYNLVKQLMRLFPSYFNEIGSEEKLHDISSLMDEQCKGKDVLVHFLRKQSQVESSSKIISLIEAVLEFWRSRKKEDLKFYLPQYIYDQIESEGPYIDGVHEVLNFIIYNWGLKNIPDLLMLKQDYLADVINRFSSPTFKQDIKRAALAISLYKLLYHKYKITHMDIEDAVDQLRFKPFEEIEELKNLIHEPDLVKRISGILHHMRELKSIILSTEKYEVSEDTYGKRHISAETPSMYGSYHEARFDAMGLTFRLEALVNTLFESLIEQFDFEFINYSAFSKIYDYLDLFKDALDIDGIAAREFERQLSLLKRALRLRGFTFTQYQDIFRGFSQVVSNIVNDYFNTVHQQNLEQIIPTLDKEKILPKYMHGITNEKELPHRAAEMFLRDTLASSFPMQKLDLFITRIVNTLYKQAERLPENIYHLLLTYHPENAFASIIQPSVDVMDIIHLGNKGFNLAKLNILQVHVPPGFIVTTEVFRCFDLVNLSPRANKHFRMQLKAHVELLEKQTGKMFGNPDNPLLLSVRSGAAVSQPGMMDTYLNVGINESIVNGIIKETGNTWFAWDCYRRFLQSYGMSYGLSRDEFDAIIGDAKSNYGINFKRDLTPEQIEKVTLAYKALIHSKGIRLIESPEEQLYTAINCVFNSWNSQKARAFRKIMGISDDWGTAVTVQTMIFGNISQKSGSGVLFTHNPRYSWDSVKIWGDYTIGNQGEDVVAGLVNTYPISIYQAEIENRQVDLTLEQKFPIIYQQLKEIAEFLVYECQWTPQDIEFTFEGHTKDSLYILQSRDMEMREVRRVSTFELTDETVDRRIGRGIGVSGGAMTGRVVFSMEGISYWRRVEPKTSLILARANTVPDDIREISTADGLLTARGGATSHAAIVAARLGKTCVVGCIEMVCMEKEGYFLLNNSKISSGDIISIDGSEGSIYLGSVTIRQEKF